MSTVRIVDLCAISELVSVLIDFSGLFVAEIDRRYSETRERMKFVALRFTVVVRVFPQTQQTVYRIMSIDSPVPISAARRYVILRERDKAVRGCRGRLGREIAEQFGAIVDRAVIVPVKNEQRVR